MRRSLIGMTIGTALLLASCSGAPTPLEEPAPTPAPDARQVPAEVITQAQQQAQPEPAQEKPKEKTAVLIPVVVSRVIDGDTAEMRLEDGRTEKVRFIGVDTPESRTDTEPYGSEASAYTKAALDGREVWLELDVEKRDRYGRLLAYVWLARPEKGGEDDVRGKMFNARLLTDGYAQIMTVPPNVKYVDLFVQLQREAREGRRGLWGLPAGGSPAPSPRGLVGNCDPSYPDHCIPPPPPDLDCGDMPYRRFRVLTPDPHGLDGNRDGIGCER